MKVNVGLLAVLFGLLSSLITANVDDGALGGVMGKGEAGKGKGNASGMGGPSSGKSGAPVVPAMVGVAPGSDGGRSSSLSTSVGGKGVRGTVPAVSVTASTTSRPLTLAAGTSLTEAARASLLDAGRAAASRMMSSSSSAPGTASAPVPGTASGKGGSGTTSGKGGSGTASGKGSSGMSGKTSGTASGASGKAGKGGKRRVPNMTDLACHRKCEFNRRRNSYLCHKKCFDLGRLRGIHSPHGVCTRSEYGAILKAEKDRQAEIAALLAELEELDGNFTKEDLFAGFWDDDDDSSDGSDGSGSGPSGFGAGGSSGPAGGSAGGASLLST